LTGLSTESVTLSVQIEEGCTPVDRAKLGTQVFLAMDGSGHCFNSKVLAKVLVDFRIFRDRIERLVLERGYVHEDSGFRGMRNSGQGDSL
jgi:hypothetical protein